MQLIWEAFNLFNRDNINGVEHDATTASTGTTLTPVHDVRPAADEQRGERIMQLAVKVIF